MRALIAGAVLLGAGFGYAALTAAMGEQWSVLMAILSLPYAAVVATYIHKIIFDEIQGPVMKPFQIFEKHPDVDAYRFGPSFTPYAIVAKEKRLTEAELTAEYWASHGEANAFMTGNPPLRFSRRAALRRFATLPHYDED